MQRETPDYYRIPEGAEDIIDLALHREMPFTIAAALKYIYRAGIKDGETYLGDLKKARECIDREIERIKRKYQ